MLVKIIKELFYIIISIFDPIMTLFDDIFNFKNLYKKIILSLNLNNEKINNIGFSLYYLIIIMLLMFLCYPIIIDGIIYSLNKIILFLISILTLIIVCAFIVVLSINFKTKLSKYFFYGLSLILIPLFFLYWIASIERHDINLYYLSADQWINIFEIFTSYFSACFIALVLGYRKR